MSATYTHIPDLQTHQAIPPKGTLSNTLYQDDHVKVVLFSFAAGEELSEHTASMPAVLHFVQGEASLTLGNETIEVAPGAWVHMPAHLPHSLRIKTPTVMLLELIKGGKE